MDRRLRPTDGAGAAGLRKHRGGAGKPAPPRSCHANPSPERRTGARARAPASGRTPRHRVDGRARLRLHPRGSGALAHVGLHVLRRVAVEEVSEQAAVEVGGPEQPVRDGEREVHVALHHDGLVVVRGVVAPERVHQRAVAHEPVLVDVAAEVHELVDQVDAGGGGDQEPADVRGDEPARDERRRGRDQDEHHQRIGREHRHPPVVLAGEAHLLVGEELVVHEHVPRVDGAGALPLPRAVHHLGVDPPLEDVAREEHHGDGQPLPPPHALEMREIDEQGAEADEVDDRDVQIAVVPGRDAVPVDLAVGPLALVHR